MAGKKSTAFAFKVYVYRSLKKLELNNNLKVGISGAALSLMLNLITINCDKIMKVANKLLDNKKTITTREIQSATRLTIPGMMLKHCISEGTKAVTKYNNYDDQYIKENNIPTGLPRNAYAGLVFSVSRVEKMMMEKCTAARKSAGAAIYLTAVLEYLTEEILFIAGLIAQDLNRKRITVRHIKLAIALDEELLHFHHDTIIGGGVIGRNVDSILKKLNRSRGYLQKFDMLRWEHSDMNRVSIMNMIKPKK